MCWLSPCGGVVYANTLQLEMNVLALSVVARAMQLDLNMLFKTRRASAPTLIAALKNDSKIE